MSATTDQSPCRATLLPVRLGALLFVPGSASAGAPLVRPACGPDATPVVIDQPQTFTLADALARYWLGLTLVLMLVASLATLSARGASVNLRLSRAKAALEQRQGPILNSVAEAFLAAFNPAHPGCLVLDVRMRGMSGLDLQGQLAHAPLHPPIVMVTGHGDVPMAVRAVKAGAVDFLEKPFNDQALLDAVHRALALDARNRGEASQLADIAERLDRLTRREREVLEQVVAGKRNKVFAADLGISQSTTVEAHRAKVMEKLEARSLSDLMRVMLISRSEATPPGEGGR